MIYIPYVILGLTNKCNMNCSYCYIDKVDRSKQEKYNKEAIEFALTLVNKAVKESATFGSIKILSAEPTIVSANVLANIVNLFHEVSEYVEVVTNGQNLADDMYRATFMNGVVNKNKFSVAVSIDGPASVNDSARGIGTYAKAIKTVKTLLREYSIPVSIGCVITEESIKYRDELLDWGKYIAELGAKLLPNAVENSVQYSIDSRMGISLLIRELSESAINNGMYELDGNCTECDAIFINNDGNVYDCTAFSNSVEFARLCTTSYKDILNTRRALACSSSASISSDCIDCDLKHICEHYTCHKFRVDGKSLYCLKEV